MPLMSCHIRVSDAMDDGYEFIELNAHTRKQTMSCHVTLCMYLMIVTQYNGNRMGLNENHIIIYRV